MFPNYFFSENKFVLFLEEVMNFFILYIVYYISM
jgi:hypothetical protein